MSNYDYLFVPDPCATYIGIEAKKRLATVNDSRFAGKDGIVQVDRDRWDAAQVYERKTWMEATLGWTDARNFEFAWGFDAYRALPKHLGRMIELGAGPFTNARLILQRRTADRLTLLDPLIADYLHLHTCPYRSGVLEGVPVTIAPTSLEDWAPEPFDTVVIINTIHHCFDAKLALDHTWEAVAPGGWLVFYDPPREIDPTTEYDVGHPLAPKTAFVEKFLSKFTEAYRDGWYFIGRRDE